MQACATRVACTHVLYNPLSGKCKQWLPRMLKGKLEGIPGGSATVRMYRVPVYYAYGINGWTCPPGFATIRGNSAPILAVCAAAAAHFGAVFDAASSGASDRSATCIRGRRRSGYFVRLSSNVGDGDIALCRTRDARIAQHRNPQWHVALGANGTSRLGSGGPGPSTRVLVSAAPALNGIG